MIQDGLKHEKRLEIFTFHFKLIYTFLYNKNKLLTIYPIYPVGNIEFVYLCILQKALGKFLAL